MTACKDLTGEMPGVYDPKTVEAGWYKWWQDEGFFNPLSDKDPEKAKSTKPYTIVLPPPNVTGYLHLGHALTSSVQDSLIRWHRMCGDNTLYVPGLDHAGIATQVVVEKKLWVEEKKTRHDVGRDEFVQRVWKWKEEHGNGICNQLHRTACSTEWSRLAFSMDEKRSAAVLEAFNRMAAKGVIKRACRLVNWSCTLRSAISDIEVDKIDIDPFSLRRVPGYEKTVEFGFLYHFAYKVVGTEEELVVATTRPETILGDTAVAIHPEDPRYKKFHGMKVKCPFRDEEIPIVLDPVLVNMEFGTGVVKVTPAHDPNDFETGQRHNLPMINIMTNDGMINEHGGEFKGQKRYECRANIMAKLKDMGLERAKEKHSMALGICSRSGDVIEPILKPQWFMDCTNMAKRAKEAVAKGDLKLIPEDPHTTTWNFWLDNIRPWCISRQLWWGHRIPAWYCTIGERDMSKDEDPERWIVARSEQEAKQAAIEKFKISAEDQQKMVLAQDDDVLDTWFAASLHPMYTLGWPNEEHPDFKQFFPTQLLETGHDILFFWVARMVMSSLELTDTLPFSSVYLHALVRDKEGEKMSKSKGNVVDPIDVMEGITLDQMHSKLKNGNLDAKEIEKATKGQKRQFPKGIAECGSDALRFGLLSYTASGRDVNLNIDKVVAYRHFCNKLWQASKYAAQFFLGADYVPPSPTLDPATIKDIPFSCQWILSRLDYCAKQMNENMTEYNFATATQTIYSFWLYDLCDVFLEISKPLMKLDDDAPEKQATKFALWICISNGLKLLHPMMPFVTEELWQRMPGHSKMHKEQSIMVSDYPTTFGYYNAEIEEQMKLVQNTIHAIRSMKSAMSMKPKDTPPVHIIAKNEPSFKLLELEKTDIQTLGACGDITLLLNADPPKGMATTVINQFVTVFLDPKGLINPESEKKRLAKDLDKTVKSLDQYLKKKQAADYTTKVPPAVQEINDQKIEELTAKKAALEAAVQTMQEILSSQ